MQRLTLFLFGALGLVAIFLLFKVLFSVPSVSEEAVPAVQVPNISASGALSSSLNLIVRVSPRLSDHKKDASLGSAASVMAVPRNETLYQPYAPDRVLGAQGSLLFFAQTDDPFSLAHEEIILAHAIRNELRLPVFRVDFSSKPMKLEYGVIVPDTFVLLDATGQRVRSIIHPSTTELRSLLTSSPESL